MSTGQDMRNILELIMARKKANNQHIGPTILVGLFDPFTGFYEDVRKGCGLLSNDLAASLLHLVD